MDGGSIQADKKLGDDPLKKSRTPVRGAVTPYTLTTIFNSMLSDAVELCGENERSGIMSQMTKLVEKYRGLSVDAISVLFEGYRLNRGPEVFDKLMGWTLIDMVYPTVRFDVEDIPSAFKTYMFLTNMMERGLDAVLPDKRPLVASAPVDIRT